ncbi:MAG: hypothetical protein JOY99_13680 [Sphingomonadaceae bacterium]|nr:hypothetical protein [Sphingomonadaceae bacterium]
MRTTLLATLLLGAAPAVAAPKSPPLPPKPIVVTVNMFDRGFHPDIIRLRSGVTYRLVFINRDGTTHDFFAPRLLEDSQISREEGDKLQDGRLDVPAHGEASLVLMPMRAEPYDAKSTKALDVVSNMRAQVLVY